MTVDARYPIGKFEAPKQYTPELNVKHITDIAAAPGAMRAAVAGLTVAQLDTPYREGGWTIRQVAHHVPDSHINAYVRMRLALTEQDPTVKTYDESKWAELVDAKTLPVDPSLALLDALHTRWTTLLHAMTPAQWARRYLHPEYGMVTMEWVVAQYSWHGRHHVGQITTLRASRKW